MTVPSSWLAGCLGACLALTALNSARGDAPAGERATVAPTAKLAPDSIYHLRPKLTDDRGQSVGLDLFAGHPVLIAMVYASCTSMCPLVFAELERIDAALSPLARARTRVLLVSFDSVRDTPASLAKLAVRQKLDRERYRLVRANPDDTRAIAALLGVRYRVLPNGEFAHTSLITALDRAGRPLARLEGIGNDASAVIAALSAGF